MDTLYIKALNIATQIGVHAWEQRIKQNLLIDITIPADFSACGDTLANTLDYDMLCKAVSEFVGSKAFQLIETVANEVAGLILERFTVGEVRVVVSKPHAVANAGMVQVEVTRSSLRA